MSPAALLLLSAGVAADATAVAATRGLSTPRLGLKHVLGVGAVFGGFHVLMPLLGWQLGQSVGPALATAQPWLAGGVLLALGLKLTRDGLASTGGERPAADWFSWARLLPLGLFTSLDALAVGVALPMLEAPPALALGALGGTTALLSSAGLLVGARLGAVLGGRVDLAGGLVLVGLGLRVLAATAGA
jgi:putative Mn2+ efflux pump MntP